MTDERGSRLERFLAHRLGAYLLPDFVIANPKIRFGKGKEEELADVIVPYTDHLLTMQFKSRKQEIPPMELEEKDYKRIIKKITEASDQAKTTMRAHKQGLLREFTNLRGIKVPLNDRIDKIFSVIILQLDGEEKYKYFDRTRFIIPYFEKHEMPHHVFFHDDFEIILQWLDTIHDLWSYLDIRQKLLCEQRMKYPFYEPDLLSCYLFSYPQVEEGISRKGDMMEIETGKYFKEIEEAKELIKKREIEFSTKGWVVDRIINELHMIMSPDAFVPDRAPIMREPKEHAYMSLISKYGCMGRLERYWISEKYIEKMAKAEKSDRGYNFFLYEIKMFPRIAFLFIATRERNIDERFKILETLSFAAFHQHDADEIVSVITDTMNSESRSFQFLVYRHNEKSESELEWHRKHRIFADPKHESSDVWGVMRRLVKDEPENGGK